jgi:cyclopropane fatty-acyl-phospholipid synthase-like methyltransferase
MNQATPVGGWGDEQQVGWYLERIRRLDARQAGERMLVDALPAAPASVLDLGCGDGALLALTMQHRPSIERGVGLDRSAPMLARARERFAGDPRVGVREADLNDTITAFGTFDVIVSGFAIHHLPHERKRALFREIDASLEPGGVFANLEVVASETPELHAAFLAAIGRTADDPEDRLATIEDQSAWLRDAGLRNVGCLWRWRGFALLVAERAS